MPAYNEEGAIADAVAEVQQNVLDRIPSAELIVVDDGSRDATGSILDGMASADPRVRVIHKPNAGHGPALITGLAAARGEFLFLLDSDRQIPLESFAALWAAVQSGHDGAFGVRRQRNDPELRLLLTRVVRFSIGMLFGVGITDANVPFKLFRRTIWLDARRHIPDETLAPSLFLAVYMARRGCDIVDVDVPHRERETGVVSIRRWKLLKFCWRAFRQMLSFRRSIAT
jgi:glycosyltransferase involved in cell wall biosynthesis